MDDDILENNCLIILNEVFNELNLNDVKDNDTFRSNFRAILDKSHVDNRVLKVKYWIAFLKYVMDNITRISNKKFTNDFLQILKMCSNEDDVVSNVPYNKWLDQLNSYN